MKATNYNRNWMFWGSHVFNGGTGEMPTRVHGDQRHADLGRVPEPRLAGQQSPVRDRRQHLPSRHVFARRRSTTSTPITARRDRLTFFGQVGYTHGIGKTPKQDVFEGDVFNTGAAYTMHGIGSPVDVRVPERQSVELRRHVARLDLRREPGVDRRQGNLRPDRRHCTCSATACWSSIKFGARYAEHERDTHQVAQGPNFALDPFNPANLPHWNGETYPGELRAAASAATSRATSGSSRRASSSAGATSTRTAIRSRASSGRASSRSRRRSRRLRHGQPRRARAGAATSACASCRPRSTCS